MRFLCKPAFFVWAGTLPAVATRAERESPRLNST